MKEKKYNERYRILTGTSYDARTPETVIGILEDSRIQKLRLRFHYGDTKTGKAWGDIETGHVGRSTGPIKIPLLIKTARSHGGGGLLDHCLVKIEHTNKKNGGIIYDITKK